MFNKFALVFAGLMLTVSSVGCCCLGGYGYGAGYGSRGCAPCPNQCAPMGGGYYPPTQQGAFFQGMDANQTAFAGSGISQTAYAQPGYPTTTAALPPGAIQGQPIYLNAGIVPANTLPVY